MPPSMPHPRTGEPSSVVPQCPRSLELLGGVVGPGRGDVGLGTAAYRACWVLTGRTGRAPASAPVRVRPRAPALRGRGARSISTTPRTEAWIADRFSRAYATSSRFARSRSAPTAVNSVHRAHTSAVPDKWIGALVKTTISYSPVSLSTNRLAAAGSTRSTRATASAAQYGSPAGTGHDQISSPPVWGFRGLRQARANRQCRAASTARLPLRWRPPAERGGRPWRGLLLPRVQDPRCRRGMPCRR